MAERAIAQRTIHKGAEQPWRVKGLGLFDSTMIVVGSMIGSAIYIVSSDIAHQVQSPGLLRMVWVVAGVMTLIGGLSYGELAAAMPHAGGQ
jgi:basic amino acid/polyamine antiporter, APA family